jgi:hypothetical protein
LISKDSSWLTADRSKIIVASLIGSLVLIPSVNYVYSGGFFLSRGSHIFMFSHLAECGVMERYLKEQCQKENLNLCAYKDDFKDGFLWRSEGAFKDLGRFDGNVEEYKRVNRAVLTSPKYWPLLAQKAIEYTAKQLVTFEAKVDVPQGKGSAPYSQIEWRYRDALYEYGYSKQNQGSLSTKFVNAVQPIIILASAILLLLALLYSDRFLADDYRLKKVIITVLLFMLVSAMACSNLSTVHPRYQSRIAWIMPIMTSVLALRFRRNEQ